MITKTGLVTTPDFIESNGTSTLTVTGSLTNNNGVYSGFSSANYINTNCNISCTSNKLIIHGSYTTSSDITSEQYVFATTTRCLAVTVLNSKFRLQTYANNNWSLSVGTTTLSTNIKHYFKIVSDNTTIKLYVLVNSQWVQNCSITLPAAQSEYPISLGVLVPNTNYYARGSIDVKDWSVLVNNVEIWNGYETLLGSNTAKIGKNFVSGRTINEI